MGFVCAAHLYLIHQSISLVAAYVSSFRDFFSQRTPVSIDIWLNSSSILRGLAEKKNKLEYCGLFIAPMRREISCLSIVFYRSSFLFSEFPAT